MHTALLIAFFTLAAGDDRPAPAPPPLVAAPPSGALLPDARAELLSQRATLIEQRPGLGAPIAFTAIAGGAVLTAVVLGVVAFFSSWVNDPCSDFCLAPRTHFDGGQAAGWWISTAVFAVAGAIGLPFAVRNLTQAKARDGALSSQVNEIDETLARGAY